MATRSSAGRRRKAGPHESRLPCGPARRRRTGLRSGAGPSAVRRLVDTRLRRACTNRTLRRCGLWADRVGLGHGARHRRQGAAAGSQGDRRDASAGERPVERRSAVQPGGWPSLPGVAASAVRRESARRSLRLDDLQEAGLAARGRGELSRRRPPGRSAAPRRHRLACAPARCYRSRRFGILAAVRVVFAYRFSPSSNRYAGSWRLISTSST